MTPQKNNEKIAIQLQTDVSRVNVSAMRPAQSGILEEKGF